MTTRLDEFSLNIYEQTQYRLECLRDEIATKEKEVALLESQLKIENLSHQPVDGPRGKPVNDIEDRERMLAFLKSKLNPHAYKRLGVGIFSDVFWFQSVCNSLCTECPQWFTEKYGKACVTT